MQSGTILRLIGATAALTIASCGGGDDEATTSTTSAGSTASTTATTAPPTTAAPTTAPTTTPPTTVAPTTAPPTTVAPTTPPPTTAPLTTTAATTTTPPTTAPTGDLAQFCFDSEQALVADRVIDGLDDPTSEQVEAALRFLAFSVGAAAQSAPPELAEQPQRAAVLVDELREAFAEHDFDPDAFPQEDIDALEPILDEYTTIMADLQQFLTEACDSPLDTLEDQATKLGAVVADLVTWELVPIANQAGDVRMLVPEAWDQWFGSDELTFEVSFLQAAPDLQAFEQSWDVPGVILTVLYGEDGQAVPSEIVAETAAVNDCTGTSSEPYEDAVYVGELHRYTDCAETGTEAVVVAVTDLDTSSREIVIEMQFPDGVDDAVLDQFLAGFVAG